MNYFEWAEEYTNTANSIAEVIKRLKNCRNISSVSDKKELDHKIAGYKIIYNECIQTANHLMERYRGVA